MNDTTTATVKDRVTAVLARHYTGASYLVSSVTGGTAAIVTAGKMRTLLQQYAATLRANGFIVTDYSSRGRLYVREHGPEHDVAMAREVAGICRTGYNEHIRLHGPDGDRAAEDSPAEFYPARFTVEREGHLYDVIVMPRGEGQS